MTSVAIWNKIVEYYNKNFTNSEQIIQNLWENIFADFFGYRKLLNEIDSKRSIQIGSYERIIPDIILKKNGEDIFIVEMKQHSLDTVGDKQLITYFKQLNMEIGILIAKKIHIFDYDYSKTDEMQDRVAIEFTLDNPDGIKFVELFQRESYSKEEVKKFIQNKKVFIQNVKKIENEINSELIRKLVFEYFDHEFMQSEIKEALSNYDVSILKRTVLQTMHSNVCKANNVANRQDSNKDYDSRKIGEIIQNDLVNLFIENKVPKEIIELLLTQKYSSSQFKTSYPVLKKVINFSRYKEECKDSKGRGRYYSSIILDIYGDKYLVSSQWLEISKCFVIDFIKKYL